jgi:dipeptidyl aminopeptidase/acylaminoacyl peptidase
MIERFSQMPSALRSHARWQSLGLSNIPALLIHPDWNGNQPSPMVLWMHGRTVNKELDPGRYLRWLRAGFGTCAVDLPGHGERLDQVLQDPTRSFDVVRRMIDEIDEIIDAVNDLGVFDMSRLGIGGMSAGGMATLARLCRPHPFVCASVEATTGSWLHQRDRQMFRNVSSDEVRARNPIEHLDGWRNIPLQAIHARLDEWVPLEGQEEFIHALRSRYHDPSRIEWVIFDRTGAPNEHAGFGQFASEAKDAQRDFFKKWLLPDHPS